MEIDAHITVFCVFLMFLLLAWSWLNPYSSNVENMVSS